MSKNHSICLLKQDKGRGVIVLDKQFVQLNDDPTEKFEGQVQRKLRELKKNGRFTEQEYATIYPSSSRPGRFYATGKRHKVPENSRDINHLPLRPIVSNIGTATYRVSKYQNCFIQSACPHIPSLARMTLSTKFEMKAFQMDISLCHLMSQACSGMCHWITL